MTIQWKKSFQKDVVNLKISLNYQVKVEILTSNDIYAVASSNGKTKKTGRLKMIIRKKVNNSSSKGKTNRWEYYTPAVITLPRRISKLLDDWWQNVHHLSLSDSSQGIWMWFDLGWKKVEISTGILSQYNYVTVKLIIIHKQINIECSNYFLR